MKLIPFDKLYIPEYRMRREFDPAKLSDLADSILSKGLMHPIVVVEETDGRFRLVAGERRSKAITLLNNAKRTFMCNNELIPPGYFPATLLSDLSPIEILEAEFEENVIRADLTWQEHTLATAALAELRKQQTQAAGGTFTIRAVASEIAGHEAQGGEITKVSNAVIVAQHLADPEVAKAKSQKEALKIIQKKAETAHREVLAQTFDLTKTPHTALLGSSLELAKGLPDNTFDVILTDPPYGIDADKFGSMADVTHQYKDDLDYALTCYGMVAKEGYRVCKDQAHAYVFLDPRYFEQISLQFTLAGWEVWPIPLIWNKGNGMLPRPEHGPRRTYEAILFASKGGKKVVKVMPDVLTYALLTDKDHGAQKPVPLYVDLLSRSTVPGNKIVDFFSGSGTIFPACNRLRLVATGMEISEQYYNLGVTRLNETEELAPAVPSLESLLTTLPGA